MPNFKVQVHYTFEPGTVNGSTESPPPYLLGEDGVVMLLAVWPEEPLDIVAANEDLATGRAQMLFAEAGRRPFINTRIGEERFLQLTRRQRPCAPSHLTSVAEIWLAGTRADEWHLISVGTPRFG